MATGRSRNFNPWLALLALALAVSGCAQPGPFASRQSKMGTLKTSVSQLEYENDNLRNQVAELKTENTRFATKLEQEEDANGELSARLDDAKDLLRRQGGDVTALAPSRSAAGKTQSVDDDGIPPPIAFPPARRSSRGRKPPAAAIPRADPADPDFDPGPSRRDLGPRSEINDDRWLPVARGIGTPVRL